jgi:hypothetical protein
MIKERGEYKCNKCSLVPNSCLYIIEDKTYRPEVQSIQQGKHSRRPDSEEL